MRDYCLDCTCCVAIQCSDLCIFPVPKNILHFQISAIQVVLSKKLLLQNAAHRVQQGIKAFVVVNVFLASGKTLKSLHSQVLLKLVTKRHFNGFQDWNIRF